MLRLIFFITSLISSTTLFAHETWLMPDRFSAALHQEIRFDLSSGMGFPQLDNSIYAQRVAKAASRLNGEVQDITSLKEETHSLVLRQAYDQDGIATIWVELPPREIELDDDNVVEYLDEINASDNIRSICSSRKNKVAWKESYAKHAKTHISIGTSRDDSSWKTGIGTKLELVIVNDPLSIMLGDDIEIQLLSNYKVVPDISIGLLIEGSSDRIFQTTDINGNAKFTAPRAGKAMFFAVQLQPNSNGESWDSDFATLTLEISPKR